MRIILKIYRKKKRKLRRLTLFSMILLSFFLLLILTSLYKKEFSEGKKEKTKPHTIVPDSIPSLKINKELIQKGTALTDILNHYDFSATETHRLREEVKPVYDLAKIKAGHEFRIYTSQEGTVVSLEYDIDRENYLQIQRSKETYQAEIKKISYDTQVRMIWGIIKDNLISAFILNNERDTLALYLAEIFAWDIDFYTDPRPNDSFKIIFEKKFHQGKFAGYGNILAAEFTNQGKTFQAFRYTYPDTEESDYFNFKGDSLRKEFLKSPIKFARITSRFSYSRLHPIRKVYRPHFGVDYAARVGTPVQSTADGTVTFIGWNGASGRMVKIRHKNAYETMYLHLKNYAKGIRRGAKVKGGQVIGYVGSSGESTGPHLDYRIKCRRKYINPLAWRFKPVKPLPPEFKEDFKRKAETYRLCFNAQRITSSTFSGLF